MQALIIVLSAIYVVMGVGTATWMHRRAAQNYPERLTFAECLLWLLLLVIIFVVWPYMLLTEQRKDA